MQRAKAVEGAVGTSTVANMMKRDHMRAFLRRAATLAAFVALLWAVQVVNWITGYGLNPAFGLIPRQLDGLDGVVAMPLMHGSFAHLMANTPPLLVMAADSSGCSEAPPSISVRQGWSSAGLASSSRAASWIAPRSRWARHYWSVSSIAPFSGAFFRANPASRGRRISSAPSRSLHPLSGRMSMCRASAVSIWTEAVHPTLSAHSCRSASCPALERSCTRTVICIGGRIFNG